MAYKTNIPLIGNEISSDLKDINQNFTELQNGGVDNTNIQLNKRADDPTPRTTINGTADNDNIALYSKEDGDGEINFFAVIDGDVIQITKNGSLGSTTIEIDGLTINRNNVIVAQAKVNQAGSFAYETGMDSVNIVSGKYEIVTDDLFDNANVVVNVTNASNNRAIAVTNTSINSNKVTVDVEVLNPSGGLVQNADFYITISRGF